MNRLIHGFLWGMLGLILVAGLGGPAQAGDVIENTSYTGEKIVVRWAFWGGEEAVELYRAICEQFVEQHPEIAVELSIFPWGQYWAKLQTQVASGLAPDVISLVDASSGIWINHGALRPLDDLVATSGVDLEPYYRAALDNFRWEGQLYAFPLELVARAVVFSVDRLEERGIPPEAWPQPDAPLPWADYKTLAEKLTLRAPDGTIQQYAMGSGEWWNDAWTEVVIGQYGGTYVDRRINPTRATVAGDMALAQGIIEWYQNKFGAGIQATADAILAADYKGDNALRSSQFAMAFLGPWALRSMQAEGIRFGLAPIPHGPVPRKSVSVNGIGIYVESKQPEEAWKLIQFLSSEPAQEYMARSLRGLPVIRTATDAFIDNTYGIAGVEAYLAHLDVAEPFLSAANNYVSTAALRWHERLEVELQNAYDRRLLALQSAGTLTEANYAAFATEMNALVETTVQARLPDLQTELTDAFARAERPPATAFSQIILPLLLILLMASGLVIYLVWIRRQREAQPRLARRETQGAAYLALSPWIIGFICFTVGPILASVYLSFTEWNMVKAPEWVGAQHYLDLLKDPYFALGLEKTFTYAALVIPISMIGGILTAALLTSDVRGADAFKAIFYFPSLFTGAAAAVLWVNMFHKEYGVINRLLSFFDVVPINWLDEQHAFLTVVLMNIFWIGGATIIYYAGMKQIPRALYEAAEMDGAGLFRRFFRITLPLLSPIILFMVVMTTIGAFQVFTPALFFVDDPQSIGRPGDALRFYSVSIYNEAFNNLHMGRACSWAVILFGIIFLVTMAQFKLSKRFVHTEV